MLKDGCHLIFFFDKFKVTPIVKFLESLGMKARQPLYYIKSNPCPSVHKVGFSQAVEQALWFSKNRATAERFNWRLGYQVNYVVAPLPTPHYHPTQKPLKVLEVWIDYLSKPNEVVLDPFAGSGSALVAARKLGRRFIGIEKEEKFVKIILDRLAEISQSLPL